MHHQEKAFLTLDNVSPDSAEGVSHLISFLGEVILTVSNPIWHYGWPHDQVEQNFAFLLNFYATFAAEGVPPMSDFQVVYFYWFFLMSFIVY